MPPPRPANLPLELIRGEIEEIGTKVAELLKAPKVPAERERKTEIRGLLRAAFAATQNDAPLEECQRLLTELRKAKAKLSGEKNEPDKKLVQRARQLDRFGAIDGRIGKNNDRFMKRVQKGVEDLTTGITERVEKTLSVLTENPEGSGPKHGAKTRAIKAGTEERQLITTKVP